MLLMERFYQVHLQGGLDIPCAPRGPKDFYRLRIDEIKGSAVVISYTRWLESVQVKGTENQEVYVTFSPQFERIWLESKKRLPEHVAKEPANLALRKSLFDNETRCTRDSGEADYDSAAN
jgi:hypothetical protein